MTGGYRGNRPENDAPPVPSLLHRPAVTVRQLLIEGLHAAGFRDVLPAHLGVFQWPGPDGQRPGVLAARTRASKQAMNHLLHQLEAGGYLRREAHPTDRRTRVVRLTDRGWAAMEVTREVAGKIETSWVEALGERAYAELQRSLWRLAVALEDGAVG